MTTGTLTERANETQLPTPRGGAAVAAVGERVWCIGGGLSPYAFLDTNVSYDTATHTWQDAAPMPTSRMNSVAAAVDSTIYVIAGLVNPEGETDRSAPTARVEAFDTQTGEWRRCADLPFARVKPTVAVVDGLIYVFGGRENEQNTTQIVRYSPDADAWTIVGDLPIAVRHSAGCAADGSIYISGGSGPAAGSDGKSIVHDELIRFDPATSECEIISRLPISRCAHAVVAADGKLYLIGGVTDGKQFIREVDVYDTATGDWSRGPTVDHDRAIFAAAVVGDRAVLMSGWSKLHKTPVAACEALRLS